jgi:hypothetical protein
MALLKASDVLSGKAPEPRQKLCSCGCGEPLDPRVDGERQKIGGREVREDCYYASFGDWIDDHPIGRPRIRRGG